MNVNATNTTASSAGRSVPQYGSTSFQGYTFPGRSSSPPTVQPRQETTSSKTSSSIKEFDFTKYRLTPTIVYSEGGFSVSKFRL
jgi:hypothetical protein